MLIDKTKETSILEDISEDLPPLFMSGCGCWKLQARLDLYMLGQCLFEDAICCSDVRFYRRIAGRPVVVLLPFVAFGKTAVVVVVVSIDDDGC
jgi:hypothetical protein